MRGLGLSLAIIIASTLASTRVHAQEVSDRRQRADALFEQGRKLLTEAGDDKQAIAAACEKFDEAIKLDPVAPGTMLNLGLCNEKLEKYKTALYWFRKAQARAAETNLPDYERAAKEHTVALASKVATIRISFVATPPEGTRVKIDDDEIAPADYLRAEVDPGPHTLVARAPGHKLYTENFTVVGRGGQAIMIELVKGDSTVIVDRGAARRKGAVVMAAGGGLLWATSIGISFWAKGRYDRYAKDGAPITGQTDGGKFCSPTGCTPQEATKAANHYQNLARWVATPIFVGGALAIGGAIVLYVTAPDKERVDQTVLTPIVAPDQLGVALTRAF